MSYIGKSESDKIRAENTVDYITIVAGVDHYNLSQDVPGGGESNVLVVVDGKVLEPEVGYRIDYNDTTHRNDLLTFNAPLPTVGQIVFVVHKGSSTYNLVPSPGSVTDESLCENLRNFLYDNFTATAGQTIFGPLAKQEWMPASLLVTVNGVVKLPGDDTPTNDYHLVQSGNNTNLVFHSGQSVGAKVGICHLAFSTLLRRASYPYVPSDSAPPGGWGTSDIANDAVTGAKILLNNNEAIRSKKSTSGTQELIKLNTSNQASILNQIVVDATKIATESSIPTGTIDIGSSSKKFKDAYFSETVNAGTISASGDIATSTGDIRATAGDFVAAAGNIQATHGNVIAGADLSVGNDAEIQGDLTVHGNVNFAGEVGESLPVGVVLPYYGSTAPTKYLMCNGAAIPAGNEYNTLRGMCGANTPDLRQRFLIGKKGTVGQIAAAVGEAGGSFTHSHEVVDHHHDITNTNFLITDTGHSHTPSTFKVTIPNHCHFLNKHMHDLYDHAHVEKKHYHTISSGTYTTGSNTASHNHWMWVKKKAKDGDDSTIRAFPADPHTNEELPFSPPIPNPENWEKRYTSDTTLTHSHSIPGMTTYYTAGSGYTVANGGTSETSTKNSTDSGYGTSLESKDPKDSTTSGALIPWNQTRYNRASNTNPNTMDQGTSQEFSVTGTSGSATDSTHSSVSGRTEIITDLATYANVVDNVNLNNGPQPYLTVNFIIRAIA
jgi:hypothetical protein